jgi:hypothetical protein
MFETPLGLLRADLSLPALNDGWYSETEPAALARRAPLYEVAYALWSDPTHHALLSRFYASGVDRTSLEALLFGPDTLDAPDTAPVPAASDPPHVPKPPPTRSAPLARPSRPTAELQRPSGYGIFRHPQHDAWLLLKYGPHGGGHGHPDKLALELHAFGRRLSADLGTPGYGIPLNRTWYRHTVAHNTVLLDGESQPPATGELLHFDDGSTGGAAIAHTRVTWPADAPPPYAGVTLERTIQWATTGAPHFVDTVHVTCLERHLIALAFHHEGALTLEGLASTPGAEPLPDNPTYALLTETRHLQSPAGIWTAAWTAAAPTSPDSRHDLDTRLGPHSQHGSDTPQPRRVTTRCRAIDPPGATLVSARAPGNPAADTLSLLLRRVRASDATFVTVYDLGSAEPG